MKALGILFLYISSGLILHETLVCASQPHIKYAAAISEPQVYQVIISEIMADPAPSVMLPAVEYLEIFNRGTEAVDLTGWKLLIGKYQRILPPAIINPGEYQIICETGTDSLFTNYGKTLPINSMPAILNTGQVLTLKTPSGIVIHSLSFSQQWYKTSDKAKGGWSLEIIDPDNPCGGAQNWSESCDSRGGSPGILNSVHAHNPDKKPPVFLRATLPSDSTVLLHFNEMMDLITLTSPWQYSVDNGLLHPAAVYPVEPDFCTTLLKYPVQFSASGYYTLTILNSLKDCAGNILASNATAHFAISQAAGNFDLVINEVLFRASDNMTEFIELFNRSKKVLDLSAFSLALAETQTGSITHTVSFEKNPFILFPGSYVVITRDATKLSPVSNSPNPSVIVEHSGLFKLPDEEGIIVLLDTSFQTIDEFHYNKFMQDDALSDCKGVALERISPDNPSNDPENWHSASTTSGYATPGLQNSQMSLSDNTGVEISLFPETFSPDNDGVDDYVTLQLKFHDPGWMATIIVFDANGKRIKNLITNSILGTNECFIWDGKCNDERLADIGIYVIYVEIYNSHGIVKKFKKVVPLIRRL